MRIGIVGDIHNKVAEAQSIIDHLHTMTDKIVLLGDYVDDFNDDHKQFYNVLRWLSDKQADDRIVTLMGNHEASYMAKEARCAGWSHAKQGMWWLHVDRLLDTRRLLAYHREGNVLFTHAGLAEGVNLEEQARLVDDVRRGKWAHDLDYHPYDGGSNRGWSILTGRFGYGYKPAGMQQIYGHTPKPFPEVRRYGWAWHTVNMDTDLAYYGVLDLEDDVVEVYDSQLHTLAKVIDELPK